MIDFARDLRLALRSLSRSPGFSAAAVLCLALGIGATTAMFSIVYGVLLRQLPYEQADRLMTVWNRFEGAGERRAPLSGREFVDYRDQATTLEQMTAFIPRPFTLSAAGQEPERTTALRVSASYFSLIGVKLLHGRGFTAEEDRFGGPKVAVLTHELWQRRFGGDPNAVGKTLTLDGTPYQIIGVTDRDFTFRLMALNHQLWVPAQINFDNLPPRDARGVMVLARLKPGVTVAGAGAEVETIGRRLQQEYPASYPAGKGFSAFVLPIGEAFVVRVRSTLWLLFGGVALVLLIACATVANLLVARATVRQREVAIRAALGGSRWDLLRQSLAEGLLLALTSAALGTLLAAIGIRALVASPPIFLPRLQTIGINTPVLLFSLGIALLVGLLFALIPALRLTPGRLGAALQQGGRGGDEGRVGGWVRNALVIGEVAVALVVLVGASLTAATYRDLTHADVGFDTAGAAIFQAFTGSFSGAVPPAQQNLKNEALVEQIRATPGVALATYAQVLPLSIERMPEDYRLEGEEFAPEGTRPKVGMRFVSGDYFRTLGIPLVAGRDFNTGDLPGGRPVAIVDQSFAARSWPGQDPLGKRIRLSFEEPLREVVGVAQDVRQNLLLPPPQPLVYLPVLQTTGMLDVFFVVRPKAGPPEALFEPLKETLRKADRGVPVEGFSTLEARHQESIGQQRFNSFVFSLSALVALVLAGFGVYSLMAYAVAQRTREIGVRMALGADGPSVLKLMLRRGLLIAGAGVVVGLAAAFALSRTMRGLVAGVTTVTPMTYFAAALGLFVLALVGCWIPARRAVRIDPVQALKGE